MLRFLRLPRGKSTPSRIIFVAALPFVETEDSFLARERHTFRLGAARYVRLKGGRVNTDISCRLHSVDDWWRFLYSRAYTKANTWVVSHRASYLHTILQLWNEIDHGRLAVSHSKRNRGFLCMNDIPFIAKLSTDDNRTVVFVDIRNQVQKTIKELADLVGTKLIPAPRTTMADDDYFEHCESVNEVVGTAFLRILSLQANFKLGSHKYTTASQALASLRGRHGTKYICIHSDFACKEFERSAYYGGINKPLFLGRFDVAVTELDCCMQYAEIMRTCRLPRRMLYHVTRDATRLKKPLPPYDELIARVRINSHTRPYPVRCTVGLHEGIPLQVNSQSPTVYAYGRIETTLCGPELQIAAQSGQVVEWLEWSRYEMDYCLRPFADYMITLRSNFKALGKNLEASYVKSLTNALHGKVAGRGVSWTDVDGIVPQKRWSQWIDCDNSTGEITHYRSIGDNVQAYHEGCEILNSNIALAAFISSYGRVQMQSFMDTAGFLNTYYVACDAMYVGEWGAKHLERSGAIREDCPGYLRVKYTGNGGEINGINDFRIGSRRVHCGYSAYARLLTDGTHEDKAHDSVQAIISKQPSPVASVWKLRKIPRKPFFGGAIRPSGKVEPFCLSMF